MASWTECLHGMQAERGKELVLDNIKHHQLLIFNRSYFSSKFKLRLTVADLCAQTLKVMDQCAHSHTLPQHMKQCRPPHHAIEKGELRMSHSLGHHLPPDCKTSWLRLQCIRDLVKPLISVWVMKDRWQGRWLLFETTRYNFGTRWKYTYFAISRGRWADVVGSSCLLSSWCGFL